jgi:hypothetical protein
VSHTVTPTADWQVTARIQRAVTGFLIPLTSVALLTKLLEDAIARGASDDQLRDLAADFLSAA